VKRVHVLSRVSRAKRSRRWKSGVADGAGKKIGERGGFEEPVRQCEGDSGDVRILCGPPGAMGACPGDGRGSAVGSRSLSGNVRETREM
jgi:hypothetical protein